MFDTLLESTRPREAPGRFTVMSVMAHAVLIAAAAAASTSTSTAADAPRPPEPIDVIYTVPDRVPDRVPSAPRRPPARAAQGPAPMAGGNPPDVPIPSIDVRAGIPPIDLTGTLHPADAPFSRQRGEGPVTGGYLGIAGTEGGALTPDMVERIVALRVRAAPAYPPTLLRTGIEGEVRVRFVVDTLGRVEPATVVVQASSHADFSEAVRDVLPRLRFAPAQVAGRPVRQLVEMPFVFALAR